MVDLNPLTIPYLKKLAAECSITLDTKAKKADHIKKINNSGISEKKLDQLFQKYLVQLKEKSGTKQKKKKVSSSTATQFHQDFLNLKEDYYNFKSNLGKQLNDIVSEINDIKKILKEQRIPKKSKDFEMEIPELEKEVYLTYNQLRDRPHQPVKIEQIWNLIQRKNPTYKLETFSSQILKIHSSKFHLEEGAAKFYINDPNNNKKYAYVIGN